MDDLISRQAAIDAIYEMHVGGEKGVKEALPNTYGADLREIVEQIEDLPSAQPERKKGKWIWKDREVNRYRTETGTTADGEVITITVHNHYLEKINYCPVCGKRGDDTFMNYCPNCGADMREENDNG